MNPAVDFRADSRMPRGPSARSSNSAPIAGRRVGAEIDRGVQSSIQTLFFVKRAGKRGKERKREEKRGKERKREEKRGKERKREGKRGKEREREGKRERVDRSSTVEPYVIP